MNISHLFQMINYSVSNGPEESQRAACKARSTLTGSSIIQPRVEPDTSEVPLIAGRQSQQQRQQCSQSRREKVVFCSHVLGDAVVLCGIQQGSDHDWENGPRQQGEVACTHYWININISNNNNTLPAQRGQ